MKNVLKSSLNLDELNEFQNETIKNLQIALQKGEYHQKNILYISSDIVLDPNFLLQSQKIQVVLFSAYPNSYWKLNIPRVTKTNLLIAKK
jgi:hypothetical protein